MRLLNPMLAKAASYYWIQFEHRKTAAAYAIAGIGLLAERNIQELGKDRLLAAFEPTMRDWCIETHLQAHYLREYHIWEKDTKAYLADQHLWNGSRLTLPNSGSHVERALAGLASLGASVPVETIAAIDRMRQEVNRAKHDAGLLTEHFVTLAEHNEAMGAIGHFWETLIEQETFSPRRVA